MLKRSDVYLELNIQLSRIFDGADTISIAVDGY